MTSLIAIALLLGQEDAEGRALFEEKIRPLLEARCFKCHGSEAKPKGGLRLDTRELALKGGDSGAAAVPGKPAESLLLKLVRWEDPDLKMPPKEKMPAGEVALLEDWIRRGMPWGGGAKSKKKEKVVTAEDRGWWAYRPVVEPALPPADRWARGAVDRFILAKLRAEGLSPAPEADRSAFIRRATFDLHGLPPTPAEVDAFVADPASDAVERLVDRLLASPRYGERWARHWFDLVRFAESDGYKQDGFRSNAWPYRDYVIRSFNDDKPYDRFVQEQIAGDELAPHDPDVFVATGFLRLGIYEYNQRNAPGQWRDILNDLTDVTGDVFLGMGLGCAKCHDHKFDAILQRDYYRLQAFYAPLAWRYDQPLSTPAEREAYAAKLSAWEAKTADLRAQIAAIEAQPLKNAEKSILDKFIPEFQALYHKPVAERTPYEQQIAEMVTRQVREERANIDGRIKGAVREQWSALKRKLAEHDADRPKEPVWGLTAGDIGAVPPPTTMPDGTEVGPAFPVVLGGEAAAPAAGPASTGRRTALARWITRPEHPLTARVMVNRVWQAHFGRGISGVSSDFGRLGEKPTHPELLDWLAADFVKNGWTLKRLHRQILTSAAYRQSSVHPDPAPGRLKDPEGRWLWRAPVRRLGAEEIRDAMLSVSGELDLKAGGPSVDATQPRRSVYTRQMRNLRDPLLEAFDLPYAFTSEGARNSTTTATQSLLLMNQRWPLERAEAFAKRLRGTGDADLVGAAWKLAYGRAPTAEEARAAGSFLARQGPRSAASAAELPLVATMPDRGGQAARMRAAHPEDRLRLAEPRNAPEEEFSIEAIVSLESIAEDASVRVIAAKWEGSEKKPGWSFGVTGQKSRFQPRNLILQMVGREGSEVVASDLRLALNKTHYVGVSVKLGDPSEAGITFWMLDLSDPEATLRTANIKHRNTGGLETSAALTIGGREGQDGHGWDGLIDEVRVSRKALPKGALLYDESPAPSTSESTVGHWKFEAQPGFFAESTGRQSLLTRPLRRKSTGVSDAGLVDFCHVLLNSNRFLHVD
jgi:hypothetical protein